MDEQAAPLVAIRTFGSEAEAAVAKSALEAFGIYCALGSDDSAGRRRAFIEGFRLFVRSEDAGMAEDVLANKSR